MLLSRYKDKIKTVPELVDLLGHHPRPQGQSVIMCHGVFDIVHPGHIQHLLYAKGKADILVASLTADIHITKGPYRPHVPQDLRALNLAAFDFVDYVLVDHNALPIENINQLKPDFYAKGFEYSDAVRTEKQIKEADAVEDYGGSVIYTPGDVVYSSSELLTHHEPDLGMGKLQLVLDRFGLKFPALYEALDLMSELSVHVVGDTIVDSYTHCSMIGGQTKTPTISALFQNREDFVGGAAVVAKHVAAAGAQNVLFSTVLGDDNMGRFVMDDLGAHGVVLNGTVEVGRPTTNKNAIVVGGYRLLKVDTLDNRSIPDPITNKLARGIADNNHNGVVFADFRHGIFNSRTIPKLVAAIPQHAVKAADSQVASRWGNITEFKGFDLITPNEREARFSLGDQDSGVRPLAFKLYNEARCKLLILKLGERGMLTCTEENQRSVKSFLALDSFAREIVDPVGAGDAMLAYATMARCVCSNPVAITLLGSVAAALECEVDGNVPVRREQVRQRLSEIERQL